MNATRYLVCGAVSLVLHSLAISAETPSPSFNISENSAEQSVAIQLIAAAAVPPVVKTEQPEAEQPEPKQSPVEKTSPKPAPEPAKKEPVKPKAPKKEKAPENPVNQKPQEKVNPAPKAPNEQKKPTPKPQKVANKPSPKSEEKTERPQAQAQVQTQAQAQAKSASPKLLAKPTFKVRPSQPNYPRMAQRQGMEGTVLIEVWLDKEGNQTRRQVLTSSGFELLDEAAITAVKKWRFNGHQENGVALAHRVRIPVRFNLD